MLLRSYHHSMFETNTHHIQCEAYGQEETELLRATIFTSQSTNLSPNAKTICLSPA
jgi:hypothetical protein